MKQFVGFVHVCLEGLSSSEPNQSVVAEHEHKKKQQTKIRLSEKLDGCTDQFCRCPRRQREGHKHRRTNLVNAAPDCQSWREQGGIHGWQREEGGKGMRE